MFNFLSTYAKTRNKSPNALMKVTLRQVTGKTFPIEIPEDATVEDLANIMHSDYFPDSPLSSFHFVFAAKQLTHGPLSAYKIVCHFYT